MIRESFVRGVDFLVSIGGERMFRVISCSRELFYVCDFISDYPGQRLSG